VKVGDRVHSNELSGTVNRVEVRRIINGRGSVYVEEIYVTWAGGLPDPPPFERRDQRP
jgi:hypothetical protein